jgi:hypothetical protein
MDTQLSRYRIPVACIILFLSIALSILSGGRAESNNSQLSTVRQDDEHNNTEAQYHYVSDSGWVACGGIPYEGWEGCTSQTGIALKSSDGVRIYFVRQRCTSPAAATNRRESRLAGTVEGLHNWQITQATPLGEAVLVELDSPVQAGMEKPASSRWVCMWTEESQLLLIYGPDREHVVDYFNIRQKNAGKQGG